MNALLQCIGAFALLFSSAFYQTTTRAGLVEDFCEDKSGTWSIQSKSCFLQKTISWKWTKAYGYCKNMATRNYRTLKSRLAHVRTREVFDLLTANEFNGWVGMQSVSPGSSNVEEDWRWMENATTPATCVNVSQLQGIIPDVLDGDCMKISDGQFQGAPCSNFNPVICEYLGFETASPVEPPPKCPMDQDDIVAKHSTDDAEG